MIIILIIISWLFDFVGNQGTRRCKEEASEGAHDSPVQATPNIPTTKEPQIPQEISAQEMQVNENPRMGTLMFDIKLIQ